MPTSLNIFAQPERTNFYYSFSLLPRARREAMHSVYAFCRYTDDIVDDGDASVETSVIMRKRERLAWWREEVEKCYRGASNHPILSPLSKVVSRFGIGKEHLLALIAGVEMDLMKQRYETFEELYEYCYSVASVVGLMSIEVFGYKYEATRDYAVNLGIALQLTNIIRDVKTDKDSGRIYLPKEDLRRFGVSEEDIFEERITPEFVRLMQFEADRAREYFHKARTLLARDERITMFAAEIMDRVYFRLLRKIELAGFNMFRKRITVSTPHKILIAMRFWMSRVFAKQK